MKVFAIRNEFDSDHRNLAYLIYYNKAKKFYIELPDNTDQWDVPIILSSFVKGGELTVNSYWSKIWVQQRIVPSDRQNLGQILRDNNLKEYDEYELLMLTKGRCEQDDCYLVPIKQSELPKGIKKRMQRKIEYAIPLDKYKVIVFFRNGKAKLCDVSFAFDEIVKKNKKYGSYEVFKNLKTLAGGYGISWGSIVIIDDWFYNNGKPIPLNIEDFKLILVNGTVNSAEAAELLDCSRQNIDDLIKRDKLHPIKVSGKNKMFLRDEVIKREWE